MKKLLLVSALTLVASQAYAQDYQAEIGLAYSDIDIDFGAFGSGSTNATSLYGIAYFSQVDTSKGPLAEADFLDKASGIFASYTSNDDAENSKSLALRSVISEKWIIEANYADNGDNDEVGLGFGAYLTEDIDLVGTYTNGDGFDAFGANVHGVFSLQGDTAIAIDADVTNSSPDVGGSVTRFIFGGDYYFNSRFSLGATYETTTGGVDISGYGLNADWFVTDNINLFASYNTSSFDDFVDTDTITLGAAIRF